MKILSILGREHELCRAELEAKFSNIQIVSKEVALFETDSLPNIDQLGGSIKLCEVFDTTLAARASEQDITKAVVELLLQSRSQSEATGKLNFAVSIYSDNPRDLRSYGRLGLSVKKQLVAAGTGARYVAPKSGSALTAAQLKYNNLTSKGVEIVVVIEPTGVVISRTLGVQDIDSYSKRDWERPVRDSKVGMLPPKLAQIMINLAGVSQTKAIFDPFCGNGVILQEALLLGHDAIGGDVNSHMIEASRQNLVWLREHYAISAQSSLDVGDATELRNLPDNSTIVTEGYLGVPTMKPLSPSEIRSRREPVEQIYKHFLTNLAKLLPSDEQLVISFPTWQSHGALIHLNLLDQIEQMGYTFKQCSGQNTLVYRRENQFVGREIAVLVRK